MRDCRRAQWNAGSALVWDRSLPSSAKFGGRRSCNARLSNHARATRFHRSAARLVPAGGYRVDRSFAPSPRGSREANPDPQDPRYASIGDAAFRITREVAGIHDLLTHSLFADGILRGLILYVSPLQSNSAPV